MSGADSLLRRCHELEALYELATELLQLQEPEAMLDRMVGRSLEILGAQRGFLVLVQGEALDVRVARNWSLRELQSGREPVSRAIVAHVLREGQPIFVEDACSDPRFAERESVQELEIRSVLAAPLVVEGQPAGALYLESGSAARRFGARDLELFGRIVAPCSRALAACTRRLVLEARAAALERDVLASQRFPGIVTRDLGFLRVLETLQQVASGSLPVLVQGATGTGKELIVRALHCNSPRSRRPLVTLNCGAISAALLESELFGHVRGAFTGAVGEKLGLIRSADGGTLFLDEVGELPLDLQPKLLRVLQFGEVQPVGSARPETVDVRFVAATNRDLGREVREGRFREDLYYRLNAVTLQLPALAQRQDDILPLFRHFVEQASAKAGRAAVPEATPELERALQRYGWPGNVRELENEAYRLLSVTPAGGPLGVERLSQRIAEAVAAGSDPKAAAAAGEKARIELHLKLSGGNRTHAARSLGITREGLRKKMKRHGLS